MIRNDNSERIMAETTPNTTLRQESSFLLQQPQPFYTSNVADGDAQVTTELAGVAAAAAAAADRGALVDNTMSAAAIKGGTNNAILLSATTTKTMSTVDDARDDEEEESVDETSFSYSDDSASLSDAYFLPQSDEEYLARPPRYRNDSILTVPMANHYQYPLANYYGSMNSKNSNDPRRASFSCHSQTSPLWVASIIEDSEVKIALPHNSYHHQNHRNQTKSTMLSGTGASNGKQRAKDRRECRRQRQKKKQEIMQRIIRQQKYNNKRNHYDPNLSQRERSVLAVRGRLQTPTHAQNLFWALLFLFQLFAVILCAVRSMYRLWCAQTAPGLHHNFWQMNWLSTSTLSSDIATADGTTATQRSTTTTSLQELENHTNDMYSSFPGNTADAVVPMNFEFTIDFQNVISLLGVTGFYACIVSFLTFGFMLVLARSLIRIILIFSVSLALAWGVLGLTQDPYGIISMMGFAALLLTLGYSLYNWGRIPFAAQNLYTAMSALRCTADVTILGLGCLVVTFTWCVVWCMACIGVVNSLNNFECESNGTCRPHVKTRHIPLYVLLFGSFLWTSSVIKNITGVAVANIVGIWWYSPKSIGRICTPVLSGALRQAVTTSLGSICLGSLLVPSARVLMGLLHCFSCVIGSNASSKCTDPEEPCTSSESFMSDSARRQSGDDTEIVSPVDPVACLCHPMCVWYDQLFIRLRTCNQLSFTYIGVYGYGFIEAGERAIQLFETREWMDVVKDVLIQNVLLLACLIVGGSTGTFAIVVEETDGYYFTIFHKPILTAFLVGSVMGYVLSNILLLGLVGSAVNAVLVCFAADPFEFDKQHPRLSREMREVWSQEVLEPQEPIQQPAMA